MVSLTHSEHARIRQRHRGISSEVLEFILDFGHVEFGSGAAWYMIRDSLLPSYLKGSDLVEAAKPWVVVVDQDETTVITVYPRRDVSRHVRLKCRRAQRKAKHWRGSYIAAIDDDGLLCR